MGCRVRVSLLSLFVIGLHLGCPSSRAEEPKAHFIRLARALVRAEAVSEEQGRVVALWRNQYDSSMPTWRGDDPSAEAAAHAYSPGRILEVREVPADLSDRGTLLRCFVNPSKPVLPRPTLADTIVWDPYRSCAWLVSVSSTRTDAEVRAVRILRSNPLAEENAPPEKLDEWPAASEASHVTTIRGGARWEDWSVQGVSAAVAKEGILVTLQGWKQMPTRCVWFLPDSGRWVSVEVPIPEAGSR